MQFQLHKTLAWKNCEWNSWLTFCSEFKSNQSDQIAYLYTLKGLNSNDINWGSYFVAHQRNIIFCQVIFTKAYQDYLCTMKHASILSIRWENVSVVSSVMIMLTSHPTLISICLYLKISRCVRKLKSCIFSGYDHHRAAGWDHVFSYCGSLHDKGRWCTQQAQTDHHHWRR